MPPVYMTFDQIEAEEQRRWSYHPPKPGQPAMYGELREAAKVLAGVMATHCPVSRELSTALTKLDEAVMHANAAIARNT
jgi:hypothetical protein